jgi:hypothetical protein
MMNTQTMKRLDKILDSIMVKMSQDGSYHQAYLQDAQAVARWNLFKILTNRGPDGEGGSATWSDETIEAVCLMQVQSMLAMRGQR